LRFSRARTRARVGRQKTRPRRLQNGPRKRNFGARYVRSSVLHASGRGLIYRFARELLVNVIKHAGARNAQISLSLDEEQATLCMKDDGVGFTPGESPEGQRLSLGFGLSDIQQQVLSLGGTFRAENAQPEGALIRLSVPGESMVSDVGVEP